jgi:hypothetical protein
MHSLRGLFVAAILLAGGCKQILSIEDAQLDPSLGTGGEPGSGGSGGTAGSDSGDAQADGDAGEDAGSLCDQYCNAVLNNCTGEFAVYTDMDVCQATCHALPEGEPGDEKGNSINCRLSAAKLAPSLETDFYCAAAGPGGNGKCGADCEAVCTIIKAVCIGTNPHYATDADCLTACGKLPTLHGYSVFGPPNKYNGPTVQCRILHACNSTLEPDDHCPHAVGQGACSTPDGG